MNLYLKKVYCNAADNSTIYLLAKKKIKPQNCCHSWTVHCDLALRVCTKKNTSFFWEGENSRRLLPSLPFWNNVETLSYLLKKRCFPVNWIKTAEIKYLNNAQFSLSLERAAAEELCCFPEVLNTNLSPDLFCIALWESVSVELIHLLFRFHTLQDWLYIYLCTKQWKFVVVIEISY